MSSDYQIIHGNQNTTRLISELKQSAKQFPILDKDQERDLIEKNKHDRDALNRLLFMHNIRIVFNMAKAYVSKTRDFDSLIQNGMMGLARAAKEFEIDRGTKFSTCATIWVKKYMSMPFYTTQYKIDSHSVSMNTPSAAMSESDSASAEDTLENCIHGLIDPTSYEPTDVCEEISSHEKSNICESLYEHMDNDNTLSTTEKAVFKDLFLEHEKTRYISEKYKIDQSEVLDIKKKILIKFKNILAAEYSITEYSDL